MAIPEQLLENIQRDVQVYEHELQKIAAAVIDQKISRYPIFIAHREVQLPLGRPIIVAEKALTEWSINISLLEELVRKKIIRPNKVAHFKDVYKDAKFFMCLFVISGTTDANFAFYPYQVSGS